MSAVGFSKLTKSTIDNELRPRIEALELDVSQNLAGQTQTIDAEVARLESEIADLSGVLASEVSRLESEASTEQTRVNNEFTDVRSDLATEVADRIALGTNLSSTIQAVEASFNNWVASNTDEISKEVDKAILERVTTDSFNAVVAQLEVADSSLNTLIADNLNARLTKDAEHTADIERLMNAFQLLLETYHLEDADGNVITTPRTL